MRVRDLSDVAAMAGGYYHSVAVRTDGTVWAWGDNRHGQLGDGTRARRTVPRRVLGLKGVVAVAAGRAHSLAAGSDGTLWAWGQGREGQIGDTAYEERLTPVPVGGAGPVAAVAAGNYRSVALGWNGKVWAWGSNERGQLGDGSRAGRSIPRPVGGLAGVSSIAAGGRHTLAAAAGGTTQLTTYDYDTADRLTLVTNPAEPAISYGYDPNGNQTTRGTDSFQWDYEDRLTQATVDGVTATYTYRPDGLRHSRTVGGVTTTYVWDVNRDIPVVLQDGDHTYLYGLGLISQTDASGKQDYFLANGLGSTDTLTDASGNPTAHYRYDAFGALRGKYGSASTDFRYTGEQYDAALGYTYLRARYYFGNWKVRQPR